MEVRTDMKLEMRRRMHENHIDFHYDLLLIPNKEESKVIDEFCKPRNLALDNVPVIGTIKTDDNFRTYIALTVTE
jgi:hypothetical protein